VNTVIRLGDALMFVIWGLTIAYIIMNMLPIPYSRASAAIREFLDQTVGVVLRQVRRFVPPLGPLDLSPMIALFGTYLLWNGVLRPLLAG
jgi:YggT family protein